uniref:Uncharacterized protein n=1 Tax=Acrobeloides nanus TaxID=290746 RepID=A0A914C323_9BILA
MSRKHGAYHFEEESQNSLLKPDSSNQYTRIRTYIFKREIDLFPIIIGLLLGILLTLCFTAIIGFFHHAQTLETIGSLEEEKNSAIQNLTDDTEYRIKVLSSDIFTFSNDLQNLYDSIKNHTSPGGELASAKEYLEHIEQIGVKLEECQLIGDELMECKNKTRNNFKKYNLSEIEQNIRLVAGNYTPEIGRWIEEQINLHTTDDGTSRDKAQICKSLSEKFKLNDGGYWTCFFSHFYAFYYRGFYMTVTFKDDKDMMIIYKNP